MAATLTTLFTPAHVRYCIFHLTQTLPSDYLSTDPHRASVVYFSLNALDVVGALSYLSDEQRRAIVGWLHDCPLKAFLRSCVDTGVPTKSFNVAMVYAAIASLVMLGDDLGRLDRDAVRAALPTLQLRCSAAGPALDGAVMAYGPGGEADVRYVYSAAAVAALLDLWPQSGDRQPFDVATAVAFCMRSQAHDGGFGLCPGNESHGGSTFCATAALALLGQPLRASERADMTPKASDRCSCSAAAAAGGAGGAACAPCSCTAGASSVANDPWWHCCRSASASGSCSGSSRSLSAGLLLHRWLALRQRDLALADECELDTEMSALFRGCCIEEGGSKEASSSAVAGGAGSAAKPPTKAAAKAVGDGDADEDDEEEEEEEPDVNDRVMLAGPGGLTGRPGKPSDVCYTYWVAAAMAALTHGQSKPGATAAAAASAAGSAASAADSGAATAAAKGSEDAAMAAAVAGVPAASVACPPGVEGFAAQHIASFVLSCQHLRSGGFGKDGESLPDPMHTHYALAGLALLGFPGLRKVDPLLAITERAAAHLRTLHAAWAAADAKTA